MNRALTSAILAACLLFAGGASASAQTRPMEVSPARDEFVEAVPPQILTMLFRVTNTTSAPRDLQAAVTLPPGFKLISPELPFTLGPQESDLRLVAFLVGPTAAAGKHSLTYSVGDRTTPSVRRHYSVTVVVLPVAKLEMSLLEAPALVIAGDAYQARFNLANQGNAPLAVVLEITSENDYPADTDSETFTIEPGRSREITVSVKTDATLRQELRHRLRLAATATGGEKGPLRVEADTFVDVIPIITGPEDPFHRLPIEAKLSGLLEDDGETTGGLQAQVSGRGALDEEGTKHLDFLFRGPDLDGDSILGTRDEYRLSYTTDKHKLHFGDRAYRLSPLTEYYIYGRGAEAELDLSGTTVSAYYMKTRWLKPEREQAAASVEVPLGQNGDVRLNYLSKKNGIACPDPSPRRVYPTEATSSASAAGLNPQKTST